MPGERLAALYLEADLIKDGAQVGIWFSSGYEVFTAVELTAANSSTPLPPNGYTILDPYFQPNNAQSLARAIQTRVTALGLPYTAAYSPSITAAYGGLVAVLIQATRYDPALDFTQPVTITQPTGGGITLLDNLLTIKPVQVAKVVQNATAFGAKDGAVTLTASNGTSGLYSFLWADGVPGTSPGLFGGSPINARANLAAGTYSCRVTDASGAYLTVQVVIGSDAQLAVLVQQTDNDVALVVSGGLAPYTYAWSDGPTTATRQGLASGAYSCTVVDARGTVVTVQVVIDPYRFYWSQNPITLRLDAGDAYRASPATKLNLSFVCEVWVELFYLSGVFTQVGNQLEQPADSAGRTSFDAQALLDAYLSEHLPDPAQGFGRADSLFRRFYFKSGQKYGTPPAPDPLSTSQQHYVVLGGLSQEEAAAGTWFAGYQAGARPFLTWDPDNQVVLPTQPAYLYYLHDSFTDPVIKLWQRVYFADGSAQTSVVYQQVGSVRRFEVYYLAVGPAQLGLSDQVVRYELWMSYDNAGLPATQVRHYVIDRAYYPQQRFFLYTNSLGGVNSLAAVGQGKTTIEVKEEAADRPRYDPALGDTLVLDRTGLPTVSVATGPRRRAQLMADQELLLSRRVTLVSGGQRWPGRVKAASYVVRDEAEGLPTLAFDFLLAKQRHFSPRLPAPGAGGPVLPVAGGEGAQP